MRISCRVGDPGYRPGALQVKILVDGKEVQECFTADEETGEAFCYALEDGKHVITDDKLKEIVLKGRVEVIDISNEESR